MDEQQIEYRPNADSRATETPQRGGDYSLPSPAAAAKSAKRENSETNVKETIESILVAFIFAFIFRAFVVEAFVIPTGSMAPTLLGAHMRFRCNDCGYRFDANYSPEQTAGGDDLYIPTRARAPGPNQRRRDIYCPNCGYKIAAQDPLDPDNAADSPPVHYGDRILVLKYLYLSQHPQRWDVVVFKSPAAEDNNKPPTYQQNFIKRLI